ncbi:DUF6019 family protein [Desulfitobacterium dehalogenans]
MGVLILYYIIKLAVENGMKRANESIEDRLDNVTLLLQAIVKEKYEEQ